MAMIELLSRATGQPLAVMDGRLITEMRTAAVSAVALDALAAPAAASLGILGSGVQARSHLAALRLVRPGLTDIRIWSRDPANAATTRRGGWRPLRAHRRGRRCRRGADRDQFA